MIQTNVLYLLQYKIVQEAVLTATRLDRLIINTSENEMRYELFGLKISRFIKYLRT